ncbi:MAG: phenylacetate--CoA ligase family protein [Fibrobacter sp.]|nr:phenylacetate--CoA ligase family protein [Fibrobacter sp.]
MNFNKIYMSCPSYLQDILVSLQGLKLNSMRYNRIYKEKFQEYLERQKYDIENLNKFKKSQLSIALERASRTIYYSNLFKSMNANWQDFLEPEKFCKIPIITKDEIRNRIDEFRFRPHMRTDTVISTSGTTGKSLSIPISNNVEPDQWAVWWRYRSWHGINRNTWCGLFASTPIVPHNENHRFWRINYAGKEIRFSGYHISANNTKQYVYALNKFKPQWLHGNTSAISLLASNMLCQGLKLDYDLKWLTVGSENVQPWQSDTMKQAFGLKPVQHYGLAEAVANISECPNGNLHTDEDFSYVEYVKSDTGEFTIVGTPYTNEAITLLRYTTGDLVTLKDGNCQCGRLGRLVEKLDGRYTDYIVLPGGKKVATLASPFHSTPGLAEAQIYQDYTGALTVRYVPSIDWREENVKSVEAKLRERVGNSIEIKFEKVEHVERTTRGKIKLVISDFDESKLT